MSEESLKELVSYYANLLTIADKGRLDFDDKSGLFFVDVDRDVSRAINEGWRYETMYCRQAIQDKLAGIGMVRIQESKHE